MYEGELVLFLFIFFSAILFCGFRAWFVIKSYIGSITKDLRTERIEQLFVSNQCFSAFSCHVYWRRFCYCLVLIAKQNFENAFHTRWKFFCWNAYLNIHKELKLIHSFVCCMQLKYYCRGSKAGIYERGIYFWNPLTFVFIPFWHCFRFMKVNYFFYYKVCIANKKYFRSGLSKKTSVYVWPR